MGKMSAQDVIGIYKELHKQNPKMNFPDLWNDVRIEFNRIAQTRKIGSIDQSWKSAGGKAFEYLAAEYIVKLVDKKWFSDRNIHASSWYKLSGDERKKLVYQFERVCCRERFEISSEPDIVVFKEQQPMVIVSCKCSLRDRVNMDLFWAKHYQEKKFKFTLVCAETQKTIGTCKKPKKPRKLAEAIYDRLYIVDGEMEYCDVVRPFKDIEKDLKRWLA